MRGRSVSDRFSRFLRKYGDGPEDKGIGGLTAYCNLQYGRLVCVQWGTAGVAGGVYSRYQGLGFLAVLCFLLGLFVAFLSALHWLGHIFSDREASHSVYRLQPEPPRRSSRPGTLWPAAAFSSAQ